METRGRYAPSPTGELHLGNVRTALAAWLGTRAAGGAFVMRVEDLDPPRVIPGAEERLLEDLRWLGLDWDEGPGVGGPHAPYRQSERLGLFQHALEQLADAGRLYGCTCSRADLKALASAPHGEDGPIYPRLCREKGITLAAPGAATAAAEAPAGASAGNTSPGAAGGASRQPAMRFAVTPGEVCFDDLVNGRSCQDVSAAVGDFVVRRADGLFAYQLAVVVDDALMGITQVVRGADLLGSTARQIQLQQALGYPQPAYAHVPLVLDEAGHRLAKRDQATGMRQLREAGVPPERVLGLLGWSLGLLDARQPVTARELAGTFSWGQVSREPWRCTAADLRWLGA